MEDFLLLENQFSEEEKLIRDAVQRFVNEQALPLIPDAYEQGCFPEKLIPDLAKLGVLGMTLPEQYGGSNASYVAYGLACQELEKGDSGLRSFVSVQTSLCMFPIFTYGTEEQRQRYLPPMARGELIGCFGLTEPDIGSDPAHMKTHARKVTDGWVLNGSKLWITNATIADLAIVWAKTDAGVRGFIVEKENPGLQRRDIHHKLALRASSTGELVLQDCWVPDSHYLPGSDKGLAAVLGCLTQARYGVAWGVIGAAMACYETALQYTRERQQFGRPLASFQLIQKDLADMLTEIVKAQCVHLHLGRLKNQDLATATMISLAKMNACREALGIARLARNLLGANGISLEYSVMRHMANLEAVFTYEGTDNIHHLILGKHITGLDAFA
ncbi:MAG: acyl-CoA dehydrogenase family protein [Gammaproteobacteria bacterium]